MSQSLYFDGRHYDSRLTNLTDDIPFWIQAAKEFGGPILELGCGTGRLAIPLCRTGFAVTGTDVSDSMLREARQKSRQAHLEIEWLKADMRDFDLRREFRLIILPANTICHLLRREDLEACLKRVQQHLETGGRFLVDVFNPSLTLLLRDPSQKRPHSEYPDPDQETASDDEERVEVKESNVYDSARQINTIKLFYRLPGRRDEITEELQMRIYFPQELDGLLKYNGWVVEAKWGDYDRTPFSSAAKRQLIVCRSR